MRHKSLFMTRQMHSESNNEVHNNKYAFANVNLSRVL